MHATRRVTFPTFLFALSTLTGAPGCDAPEEDEDLGPIEVRPFGCHWCTTTIGNAPLVNGADLSDINLDLNAGGTNTAGIKLRPGKTADGMTFQLTVDPSTERFVGVDVHNPALTVVSGAAFLGAKLVLEMPNNGQNVQVEITDYEAGIPSWSTSGKPITAYKAQYVGSQNTLQPLCPTTDPDNQWFTLILGETYEQTADPVVSRPGSVTLACVGEAASKMKLMDYGPNGKRKATPKEREATLHMITGDYCGVGHSFTASGMHVAWRNNDSSVLPPFKENLIEAKWGPEGALCLDKPRYAELPDVLMLCPDLPACEGTDFSEGVLWRTMLPE